VAAGLGKFLLGKYGKMMENVCWINWISWISWRFVVLRWIFLESNTCFSKARWAAPYIRHHFLVSRTSTMTFVSGSLDGLTGPPTPFALRVRQGGRLAQAALMNIWWSFGDS
jgi:hypothetical protein